MDEEDSSNEDSNGIKTQPTTNPFSENSQIKLLMQQLRERDSKIEHLEEHIITIETGLQMHSKKRKLNDEAYDDLMMKIEEQELKISHLINENEDLKVKADAKTKTVNRTENTTTTEIIKLIEDKLSSGLNAIKENVNQLIENKLNNITEPANAEADPSTTRSYANAVGKNHGTVVKDFRTIMMVNKNEELAEETEKKKRSNNLIIHGKEEVGVNDDKFFLDNLIKDLQIGAIATKQVERIGQKPAKRPIKIVFNNEEDKEKVLNNLKNLKDIQIYKGISITPDHTYSERMLIKEYYERAKAKNVLEGGDSSFIWRVRGSPKNGLSLKKFSKVNQPN
jgi:hypothetical protein